jgi:hypothetical protein
MVGPAPPERRRRRRQAGAAEQRQQLGDGGNISSNSSSNNSSTAAMQRHCSSNPHAARRHIHRLLASAFFAPLLLLLLPLLVAPLASAQVVVINTLLSPVINIGNVQIFGGPDSYQWSVTKQASVPRVRVAAGTNEKASVGYTVRVTRQVRPEGFRVTGNVVINNPSNANTASLTTGIIDNTNVTLRIREVIIGVTTFSGSGGETTVPAMCQSYTLEPKFSTTCTFVSNLLQPQAGQL